jgi:copper chaperone CopZ
MVCGHCEKAITKELLKIRGISKQNIAFDISKKQVTIVFDDDVLLTQSELKKIQFEAGYRLIIK